MTYKDDNRADLLIAGTVYMADDNKTIIENGAVVVRGDTIAAVGAEAELIRRYPTARVLKLPRGLVLPGLINVHTHAAMACFRGLADDLPLMQWLQEYIFPVEATLTGDMVYQATLLSIAEMIRSGTTSFCDMYLFAGDVARAAAECGMRAWVGEVLYDFPSPNYGPVENGFGYIDKLLAEYSGHPLVTITVDPHAVYTCSPDLLVKLKQKADSHDALYVIHLAETQMEVEGALANFGKTPVMHLEALGLLDERVVADHCVVLTQQEIELLARRGVKVAHCPESNMKLASGIAPVPRLLSAGVTVGLGTDGSASNNDVDMFGEMGTAARLHKVAALDPTMVTAEQALTMATRSGAKLLHAESRIGSLEPGKQADIIVLDLEQPHLTPLYSIPSQLVYAARGADVIHSVINGKVVMENRILTTLDEVGVMARIREMALGMRRKLS
ncbi:MAG: S-adenosylhomocysteine deaminase [Deltaproteobacteria bacterium RIFOXYD12_FULL_50_9]|nr:MAG: S-adenosylhomocysteine deaminase [Deltaproteobacteria bacterium RIFOXYD12_FULL_50_9]